MQGGTKKMCPGQDTQFWGPADIFDVKCAGCGKAVEFFKDEVSRVCAGCGAKIQNPKFNIGCAAWCAHAEQCLGAEITAQFREGKAAEAARSLRSRLIDEMRRELGTDRRRIEHALSVLDNAEKILDREGGNRRVVTAAAILHDIGIHEAEKKHGSTAGSHQESEGPPIARRILQDVKFPRGEIDEVCEIIANHHRGGITTKEFDCLWDADWIVNIPDEVGLNDREKLNHVIEEVLHTGTGRQLARARYCR
ncbi:MAG: HD domain-containing protein [Deltaproteobacteria bacterium]|nr:HD domain-containing protein [Deltaproteobacteria bacterium]